MIEIQGYAIDQDDLLGKGSTGNVYRGFLSHDKQHKFAIKQMDITKATNPIRKYLLNCQMKAMTQLSQKSSNYIVKLITQPIFKDSFIYLVMETLNGGSLGDYIESNGNGFDQKSALELFKQILEGYRVIKEEGIIHRDIKSDNLIWRKQLDVDDQGNVKNLQENQLCFIDFGYCSIESVSNPSNDPLKVGSPNYMSPESFFDAKYSQKSDIWAIGVVFYQIFHGQTIRRGMPIPQYFQMMKKGGLRNQRGITKPIWDLLLGMLAYHPNRRFDYQTAQQQLNIILRGEIPPKITYQQQQQQQQQEIQIQPMIKKENQQLNNTTNKPETTVNNDIFAQIMIKKQTRLEKEIMPISNIFQIDLQNILGQGATANVYMGFQIADHTKSRKYAVKQLNIIKFTHPIAKYLLQCQILSLQQLSKTNCPYIVKTHQIEIKDQYIYIVMELLMGGSLRDYIKNHSKGIPEKQSVKLFKQIVTGYEKLKELNILHRDIKPDNFVFRKQLTNNNEEDISQNQLCFIDFGFCINQKILNKPAQPSKVGSPKYMSPQLYYESKYSEKSDIWAMGIVLYEMLHGRTIDSGMNMEQYFFKMKTGNIINVKGISKGVWQLMLGMLRYRVQDRYSYEQIKRKLHAIQTGNDQYNWILSSITANINKNISAKNIQPPSSSQQNTSKIHNETPISINSQPNSTQKHPSRFVNDPQSSTGMIYTQRKIIQKKEQIYRNKVGPSHTLEKYASAIVQEHKKEKQIMVSKINNITRDGKRPLEIGNDQPYKPNKGGDTIPKRPWQYGMPLQSQHYKFNNFVNPSTNLKPDQIDGISRLPLASNNNSRAQAYLTHKQTYTTPKKPAPYPQQHYSDNHTSPNASNSNLLKIFTVPIGGLNKIVNLWSPKKSSISNQNSRESPIVNNFVNTSINFNSNQRELKEQTSLRKVNESGQKGVWQKYFSACNNNTINNAHGSITTRPFQHISKKASHQKHRSTSKKLTLTLQSKTPNKNKNNNQYPNGNSNVDRNMTVNENKFYQPQQQQKTYRQNYLHLSNISSNNRPSTVNKISFIYSDAKQPFKLNTQQRINIAQYPSHIMVNGGQQKILRKTKIFPKEIYTQKQFANIRQTAIAPQKTQPHQQDQKFVSQVKNYQYPHNYQQQKQFQQQHLSKQVYLNSSPQSYAINTPITTQIFKYENKQFIQPQQSKLAYSTFRRGVYF